MKIVHICLCGPMTDGLSYQENVISKYHRKLGYEVTVIASQWIWDKNGKLQKTEKSNYVNVDGVKIIRIPILNGDINNRLKRYPTLYENVEKEEPDILFIHDCQFVDICNLAKYVKKHNSVRTYVDNHVDYSNGAHGWLSKNILHKGLWRYCVKQIEPYVTRFYGVLPARVDFLKELYKVPSEKCELLVMGADDELVGIAQAPGEREATRKKYSINTEDFLVVTGGKINAYRPETLDLMEAIIECKNDSIKLVVFGSVDDSLKEKFDLLCQSNKINFVGWKNVEETYKLMNASDLVVFPGLHSVMWEQAVALGVPCIFRDIEGFHHVDMGGNALFLKDVTKESLKGVIESLFGNPEQYRRMLSVAKEKGMQYFSYKEISKRSIEQ